MHDSVNTFAEDDGQIIIISSVGSGYVIYDTRLDDLMQTRPVAHFRPSPQMQITGFDITWLNGIDMGLLLTANALYRVDARGLHLISEPDDNVFQYALWAGK